MCNCDASCTTPCSKETEKIIVDFLSLEAPEGDRAGFVDMAVSMIRITAWAAGEAAKKPGATVQSVLDAATKYTTQMVKQLRDAAHRPVAKGPGPTGLGLKFPTPGEAQDTFFANPTAVEEHERFLTECWAQMDAEMRALGIGVDEKPPAAARSSR